MANGFASVGAIWGGAKKSDLPSVFTANVTHGPLSTARQVQSLVVSAAQLSIKRNREANSHGGLNNSNHFSAMLERGKTWQNAENGQSRIVAAQGV